MAAVRLIGLLTFSSNVSVASTLSALECVILEVEYTNTMGCCLSP